MRAIWLKPLMKTGLIGSALLGIGLKQMVKVEVLHFMKMIYTPSICCMTI